jgi:hypothetical protein
MPYFAERGKALMLQTVLYEAGQIATVCSQRVLGIATFYRKISVKRFFVKEAGQNIKCV